MSFLYESSQHLLQRVRHVRFLKKNHSIDLSKVGIWETYRVLVWVQSDFGSGLIGFSGL